jgi:hypothetical protein
MTLFTIKLTKKQFKNSVLVRYAMEKEEKE